jgi:hypothetical protein
MNKGRDTTKSTQPRITVTGKTQRRIDPAEVAAALGAEPVPGEIQGNPGPVALYALRAEILRRRHSTGGRPGIEGASERVKIPLSEDDWHRLEQIAASMSASGFSPSPAQVASVLLSAAIQSVQEPAKSDAANRPLLEAIAQRLVRQG